ncbi:MAG: hypothetical protein AAF598_21125, partial [Bacteroidota bacterium]
ELSEQFVLSMAIVSFIVHLIFIFAVDLGLLGSGEQHELFISPIAAIYTPFSLILLYEVYLLVYYLPRSITTYIRKQYEIIMLIVIRRIFKDLSKLDLTKELFREGEYDQLIYDIVASLILFFLIFLFYRFSPKKKEKKKTIRTNVVKFVGFKKLISAVLVPIFVLLALYNFGTWSFEQVMPNHSDTRTFKDINDIFFDEFFTILIIVDVLLLLLSYLYSDQFHKVIRNSGFIISTILIRISFSTSGLVNLTLIISAVSFGILILLIHNAFERIRFEEQSAVLTKSEPEIGEHYLIISKEEE